FFQAEDGIRDFHVTGVQTCALPICGTWSAPGAFIPTSWAVNAETAIVYDFTLASLANLTIDVGVDNGIVLWLDGAFLFGATASRSEERRVGKRCGSRRSTGQSRT